MKKNLFALVAGFVMAACGGSDDSGLPTQTNPQSAAAAVGSTTDITTAADGSDSSGAISGLNQLGGHATQMVTPSASGLGRIISVASAGPTGCDCVDGSCTFDNCGSGGATINGSISRTEVAGGYSYAFDVTIVIDQSAGGGTDGTWTYEGTITVANDTITGGLSGSADGTTGASGATYTYTYAWSIDYNDVGIDGSGCAVSGSVDASVSYSISGGDIPGGAGNYSGSGTVTFNGCGNAS